MPRGHEATWPYTGRYTPAPPPPRSRGARVVPRAGSTPPPFRERPPSAGLAQPPGASRGSPPSQPGPPTPPPSPAAAQRPARSPPRRPTISWDPGPRAPVPSPARPPGIPPAGPVPVRFGREGTVWHSPRLHQDSPPWMVLGGIRPRRAGCGPHRRPQPPRHQQRPGLPGRLWPGVTPHCVSAQSRPSAPRLPLPPRPRAPRPHQLCCAGPTGNGQRPSAPALVRFGGTQADHPHALRAVRSHSTLSGPGGRYSCGGPVSHPPALLHGAPQHSRRLGPSATPRCAPCAAACGAASQTHAAPQRSCVLRASAAPYCAPARSHAPPKRSHMLRASATPRCSPSAAAAPQRREQTIHIPRPLHPLTPRLTSRMGLCRLPPLGHAIAGAPPGDGAIRMGQTHHCLTKCVQACKLCTQDGIAHGSPRQIER